MATTTSRLGLRKPDPADTISVATDLNANFDKLDNGVGSLICTSTTRPSTPFQGQMIWQTDTNSGFLWWGGTWVATNTPPMPVVLTDAATVAVDASQGVHFRLTLGGNRTLANPTNLTDGQKLMFEFVQDGTGSRTITLGSNYALGTDITAITLTTTAGKRDFMGCVYRANTTKLYVVGFSRGY